MLTLFTLQALSHPHSSQNLVIPLQQKCVYLPIQTHKTNHHIIHTYTYYHYLYPKFTLITKHISQYAHTYTHACTYTHAYIQQTINNIITIIIMYMCIHELKIKKVCTQSLKEIETQIHSHNLQYNRSLVRFSTTMTTRNLSIIFTSLDLRRINVILKQKKNKTKYSILNLFSYSRSYPPREFKRRTNADRIAGTRGQIKRPIIKQQYMQDFKPTLIFILYKYNSYFYIIQVQNQYLLILKQIKY
eukprot:TRINITY_DN2408_c0_g1_i2.p1 TRINITY_DN2408_c0_g1~~TRINITY_DN2408_c0_g1_i2.p1  ORF type:complete len:245 (-),score=-39.24 TRINITY_DN2408_c0_g1_i2:1224-1958(-)